MQKSKTVTALLVIASLMFGGIPAFANTPILPDGELLTEEGLQEVRGEGPATDLLAGAVGFMGGGITGAVGYAAEYA